MKKCVFCGEIIEQDAVFCSSCGARVEAAARIEPSDATESWTEPAADAEPKTDAIQSDIPPYEPAWNSPGSHSNASETNPWYMENSAPESNGYREGRAATAGGIAASVLCGILLFLFSFLLCVILTLRPSGLPTAVVDADLSSVLEDSGYADVIAYNINNSKILPEEIDADDLVEFLENDKVKAAAEPVLKSYIDAMQSGNLDYHITADEIIELIKTVEPTFRKEFDTEKLTKDDYAEIEAVISDARLEEFTVAGLMYESGVSPVLPYAFFSLFPLLIIGILVLMMLFDLLIIRRRYLRTNFMAAGIPLAVSGLIFTFAMLLYKQAAGLLNIDMLEYILQHFKSRSVLIGLIVFAVGAVLIALGIVLQKSLKNKRQSVVDHSRIKSIAAIIVNAGCILACAIFVLLIFLNAPDKTEMNRTGHVVSGNKYLREEEYDEAADEYESLLDLEPKNLNAYIGLVKAYVGMGEMEQARNVILDGLDELGKKDDQTLIKETIKLLPPDEAETIYSEHPTLRGIA